ncbi:HAD superfamily hydrolase (TIGR01509 family) [Krasilnikovia cinnamomea]|uniref:HAD superfamily hydrolase (TIGR01509 family) n=1 Tax=Krasilnikovia cinnamomea TaxID=349313 RepID=A0A4V2G7V9_9ACTN|nr:HAD-IA family hydrolase [Krasilnikovia cinnamomea]RZU54116.1 HAD superfamily hydrolase (TIGR01509 family) [Krasilnikovia cinnamomea]
MTARRLRAVIFDVDGTLAETERDGHRRAFNLAFRDHGLPYEWGVEEYGELLAVTGGRRRLAGYLAERGLPHADGLAQVLHRTKTAYYTDWLRDGPIVARPGVPELMAGLREGGVRLAVATTGRRQWVSVLLERLFHGIAFAATVTGDDVTRLKPHPEVYDRALRELRIEAPDAVAVEDSPPGLAAATAAGLTCLVVTSAYHRDMPFPGAAAVVPGYLARDMADPHPHPRPPDALTAGITVDALRNLHATTPTHPSIRRS